MSKKGLSYCKYNHRYLPVAKTLHYQDQLSSPIWVCCHKVNEDKDHLTICSTSKEWRQQLYDLHWQLGAKYSIPRTTVEVVIDRLMSYNNQTNILPEDYAIIFQNAIHHQNIIGWNQWFQGRVATI